MKLHLATTTGHLITGYGQGWVRVGAEEFRENIVVTAETIAPGFAPHGFVGLCEADFAALAAHGCDIVLLGTGATLRFPDPAMTRALVDLRIGLEVMNTPAACRTFNILAAEGRRVAAALIVDARAREAG